MLRRFGEEVPALEEVIEKQDESVSKGQRLGDGDYLCMGQVCVAQYARGQRLTDRTYKYIRRQVHLPQT